MSKADKILDKIVKWANEEDSIRGLIMVGSRALKSSDELSDFDISIFTTNIGKFTLDDKWISNIEKVWVYSPDKYDFNEIPVPTRLVIYESGIKVDYSIWSVDSIDELSRSDFFDTGYKVLIDKDNRLKALKPPSLKPQIPKKPTQEEFTHIISEFWFETYHIAKYLKRDDLWLVKNVDRVVKKHLLTMMEWHTLAKSNWQTDTKWLGKHLKKWLEPEIYSRLSDTFAHFDPEDSWKALIATIDVFRDISKETANLLNYSYSEDVDKNLTSLILKLQNG